MVIDHKARLKKKNAATAAGRILLFALGVAGAGLQGCSTEEKSMSQIGTAPEMSAAEDDSLGFAPRTEGKDLASFVVDSVHQAEDEIGIDFSSGSPSDTLITPAGKIERRCVEALRPGEVLLDENTVATQTGLRKLATNAGCGVIGEKASTQGNALMKSAADAPVERWFADAWWKLPFVGYEMSTHFTVPREPARKGKQVIFLHSDFQDSAGRWVVQSTLQWGVGGQYWSICNWILTPNLTSNGNSFVSSAVRVYPGNKLLAHARAVDCKKDGGCTWTVEMINETRRTSSKLKSKVSFPPMNYALGGAMDAANIARCDEYPAQEHVDFTDIAVFDSKSVRRKSNWVKSVSPQALPKCRYDVTIRQGTSSGVGLHWKPYL